MLKITKKTLATVVVFVIKSAIIRSTAKVGNMTTCVTNMRDVVKYFISKTVE